MSENSVVVSYSRQASLPLVVPRAVAVVGCGGVGSWIAYFLALAGVQRLHLFDSDLVSDHNLNRLPYGAGAVGHKKTEALKSLIRAVRPDCEVTCLPNFTASRADAAGLKNEKCWVIASTDTWASRKEAADWAKASSLPYLEASAEGDSGSIASSPADFATEDENKPGYASVPVWVGPAVGAAMMACAYALHGTRPYDTTRLGWSNQNIDFFNVKKPKERK